MCHRNRRHQTLLHLLQWDSPESAIIFVGEQVYCLMHILHCFFVAYSEFFGAVLIISMSRAEDVYQDNEKWCRNMSTDVWYGRLHPQFMWQWLYILAEKCLMDWESFMHLSVGSSAHMQGYQIKKIWCSSHQWNKFMLLWYFSWLLNENWFPHMRSF